MEIINIVDTEELLKNLMKATLKDERLLIN